MNRWYYASALGETVGPMEYDNLRELNRLGAISGDTYVFEEGSPEWRRLVDVQISKLPPLPKPALLPQPEGIQPIGDTEAKKRDAFTRAFAAGGFCFIAGSIGFVIGLILTLTIVGAIVGIPLMVISLGMVGLTPIASWFARKEAPNIVGPSGRLSPVQPPQSSLAGKDEDTPWH